MGSITNIIRDIISLDGDDFTDGQVVDMIHQFCILIDGGKTIEEAKKIVYDTYKII